MIPLRYFDANAVHAALGHRELADALREAFVEGATAPVRASHAIGDEGRLLLMPAWDATSLGVKVVTVFPRNPERGVPSVAALYLLMDGATGHPIALIDGEAMTLRRTGAASALASRYLSRVDSTHLVVVGTGALAPVMAAAHASVRSFERVSVWGRSYESAVRTASRLASEGLPAVAVRDLEAALAEADVVTCATTAREPIVRGRDVRAGTHVDLVGAFTRDMRESDDALLAQATVFVDTFAGALAEAGDLLQPIASGTFTRERVVAELADLASGRHSGRRDTAEITVFKSVGTALEDLCAARLVVERSDG